MLIVSIEADEYGARTGQMTDVVGIRVPATHIVVPSYLEEEAWSYLPYLDIMIKDGKVVAVAQGEIPDIPEPEEPEPTEETSVWDELDAAYREGVNSI